MVQSPAFRNIEMGITEWFSLAFDFLVPWFLFAMVKMHRRWWALLGLLPFPFHFGMHAIRRFSLDENMIKVNHLSHFVMLAILALMPFFFFLEMKSVPDYVPVRNDAKRLWIGRLDLIGLSIVILTVVLSLILVAGQWELTIFSIPLAMFGVYARWWSEVGCLEK
jgi:hypothetical protein